MALPVRWCAAIVVVMLWSACFARQVAPPAPDPPTALEWGGRVEPPLRVTVRVRDAERPVSGRVVSWDERGFTMDGGDGEQVVHWSFLDARQAYELARRIIDSESPQDWLRVGVLMLRAGDEELATRAFGVATRLDPASELISRAATRAHEAGGDPGAALNAEPHTLSTAPDRSGANADAGPWPELSDAERAAETARVRALADEMLARASLSFTSMDAGEFIVYSDLPEEELKRSGEQLQRLHRSVLRTLELPPDTRLFQGKGVAFLLSTREAFVQFERSAFGVDHGSTGGSGSAIGMCHLRDADVFVVCHMPADETAFLATLTHETVHGLLYRYRSPGELPVWANEGLADYIAGVLVPESVDASRHWSQAKSFVRAGGDASEILFQSYEDNSWPTRDSYAVGHMLVRHLLNKDARAMKRWIDAIKDGSDWRDALREQFALTPNQLADEFASAMTRESYYKR